MLAVLDMIPRENGTDIENMQKVVSTYAKNVDKKGRTAKEFIEQSEVMYVDEKRATRLLTSMGFPRPMATKQGGYIGKVHRYKDNVKIEGAPFSDVFEEKKSGPFAVILYAIFVPCWNCKIFC